MRTRSILIGVIIIVLAAAIAVTSIVAGKSRNVTNVSQRTSTKEDPPGTINGAVNKDLIPDNAAYTVLLRFVAHQTEAGKSKADKAIARSYLKFNGFGEADIETILAAADEFRQRVAVIDSEIEQITPSTIGRLNQLQKQRDDLVEEFAKSLTTRLDSQGQEKMNHLIKDRIKTRMKIIPASPEPNS